MNKLQFLAMSALVLSIVSLAGMGFLYLQEKSVDSEDFAEIVQVTPSENDATKKEVAQLTEKITSLEEKVTELETSIAESSTITSRNSAKSTVAKSTPTTSKAEIIYLGAGSTDKREWTESGIEIALNSSSYPAGTQLKFEAGLAITSGEVWARLKNKTTGAIINVSEVYNNSGTTTWKGSAPFTIHPGNNTYVIELRTTSGELGTMQGSRLIVGT